MSYKKYLKKVKGEDHYKAIKLAKDYDHLAWAMDDSEHYANVDLQNEYILKKLRELGIDRPFHFVKCVLEMDSND